MSSGSPPSGGRLQALLTLLIALFGPPVALLPFAHSFNLPPRLTIVLLLFYEILVFFISFLTEVWQKLKAPWIEAIANQIDQKTRSTLSHYHHHYCRYFTYEHRDLDVKGITTQGVYTLDLDDIFVELRVDPKAPHIASPDPLHSPTDLLQVPLELRSGNHTIWEYLTAPRLRDQHFVVLGPPGSGKTTLLKHLGLALIHHKRDRTTKHFGRKLPVLLSLREHSAAIIDKAEYTLADAIRESASRWKYPLPSGWIEHRLARGQCLILLDGLDEIANATQRQQTVIWVERQMRNHGNNRFVLTSRPFGYRENPLAGATILEVQPFTFQQATQFVMNWYRANEIKSAVRDDIGVRMKAEQGAHDLLRRVRETPDLFDLVVNPLLLTMIATVHRYRGTLPGARVELYKEICEVFLGRRQAARGIVQDLRAEQRQLVLQSLAYEMMLQGARTVDDQPAKQLIAGPLQQVSTALAPHDFLESIQNTSGLLLEREHNVYSFAHKTFQEYLAAVHINKHGLLQTLLSRVHDEWWHETIRLYCAQTDATPIVEACLNNSSTEALILALECEREALSLQAAMQQHVQQVIAQSIEGADSDRQRVAAEALLAQRLRQMYTLNEQTFIDTTLVTHAEYQLFLNEQRTQHKYYRPDHWAFFTFPAGQGQRPALGIRHSDIEAFCKWLSERAGGTWHYRLPDEKDLALVDRGIWKDLPQDTGYWTEGGRRFVWSQGQPSPSLALRVRESLDRDRDLIRGRDRGRTLVFDIDHDRDLVLALNRTRGRDRDRDLIRDRDLVFDIARTLARALNRTRDRDRALDLDLNHARALTRVLARDRTRVLDIALAHDRDRARPRARTLDLARDRDHAFDLYMDLFLLQERCMGRLPAWEGILLVKERILET